MATERAKVVPHVEPLDPAAPDVGRPEVGPEAEIALAFDPDWYLQTYDDVRAAGFDAFEHFLSHGRAEGRSPNRNHWAASTDPEGFDRAWYLDHYQDVNEAGVDAFQHYREYGVAEGRCANAREWAVSQYPEWFEGAWYATRYRDIMGDTADPFEHFVAQGRELGLAANRAMHRLGGIVVRPPLLMSDHDLSHVIGVIERAGVFDVDWYCRKVAVPPERAVRHYVTAGVFLGADPSLFFSSFDYFAANTDVAAVGYNPLAHYIEFGFAEGRRASLTGLERGRLTARAWHKGL